MRRLVFFMMPGLALFYGGMVRAKNVLNMFMLVMVCIPLIAVEWVAYGYNMAFAVPSAIAVDAGKGPDGNDLPKHSYLGWDPGLVFMKSFAELGVDGREFLRADRDQRRHGRSHSERCAGIAVRHLPDDVRDHHTGPDRGGGRRAGEV